MWSTKILDTMIVSQERKRMLGHHQVVDKGVGHPVTLPRTT